MAVRTPFHLVKKSISLSKRHKEDDYKMLKQQTVLAQRLILSKHQLFPLTHQLFQPQCQKLRLLMLLVLPATPLMLPLSPRTLLSMLSPQALPHRLMLNQLRAVLCWPAATLRTTSSRTLTLSSRPIVSQLSRKSSRTLDWSRVALPSKYQALGLTSNWNST